MENTYHTVNLLFSSLNYKKIKTSVEGGEVSQRWHLLFSNRKFLLLYSQWYLPCRDLKGYCSFRGISEMELEHRRPVSIS